ncbi:MAG TPA: YojF family protein [Bacillus sp. (in: firmicutes)]|jgi:hypothetical protein
MEPVIVETVQKKLELFANQNVYVHLETTNGAYASHNDESFFSSGAYIRNALVQFERGKITGNGPFRVGLKMPIGWIYAEGITHFEVDSTGRLLLAGHDYQGRLAVCLEISLTPFE